MNHFIKRQRNMTNRRRYDYIKDDNYVETDGEEYRFTHLNIIERENLDSLSNEDRKRLFA